MATAAITSFPSSFVSGDAVRVTISDSSFPSSLFTLKVWFQTPIASTDFTAPAGTGGVYDLFITPTQSAALAAANYLVAYVFTEIAAPNDDRTTGCEFSVRVYSNPAVAGTPSINRQILTAMQAAMLILAAGSNSTVNFNGQSFTKRNLKEFQEAIDRQQAIVDGEDIARTGHRRIARILHPL